MMKNGLTKSYIADEQAIAFIEEVLLEEGYMLPCEPEQISDEDLELYGKGNPQEVDVLRQSFESLNKRRLSRTESSEISASLAMAARNGTKILERVWARMQADREEAEIKADEHE